MWFWFALLSAIVGAVAVIYQQKAMEKVRSLVLMWAISAFPIPLLLLFIPRELPRVDALFYVGTIGSGVIFVVAKLLTFMILRRSTLSHIFPLSSLNTLFTYMLGVSILGENLTMPAVFGIFLSVLGVYLLQLHKHKDGRRNIFEPFIILFTDRYSIIFILMMFLIAVSGILDKTGITHAYPASPELALLVEFIVMTLILTPVLFWQDKTWLKTVHENFRTLFFNGIIYGFMALLVFWGFTDGPVALVSAVKKIQILFVMILSYFVFKDYPPKSIWWGAALMIIGIFFMKL